MRAATGRSCAVVGTPLSTGGAPRTLVQRAVTPTSTAIHLSFDVGRAHWHVTFWSPVFLRMAADDRVLRALADPTRRFLLDLLFTRDGRTLGELEAEVEMTRFGVMKHLRLPEEAGLVVTRRSGREKLHFLNPVPIRLVHDRWIDKYTERHVAVLVDLGNELERA